MDTAKIYKLAAELTESQIENILALWIKDNDKEETRAFTSLVRLGDSRALAMATTLENKATKVDNSAAYYAAYCI